VFLRQFVIGALWILYDDDDDDDDLITFNFNYIPPPFLKHNQTITARRDRPDRRQKKRTASILRQRKLCDQKWNIHKS